MTARARHFPAATRKARHLSAAMMLVGVVLLAAAILGIGYPLWWHLNSTSAGQRLLRHGFADGSGGAASHVTGTAAGSCREHMASRDASSTRLVGVLEIPSLQLKAPVLQGLTDRVLNVAVGHDPRSPWPSQPGESVIEAHDVSYFSGIGSLRSGDEVLWRDACEELTYKVVSAEVARPGSLIYPPHNGRGLALITCYPTNALFWTSDRFVVKAELVSARTVRAQPTVALVTAHLRVPAPTDLVAQGLTLKDNSVVLDTLRITGSPTPAWRAGPASLGVEADALESYFGARKAIEQRRPDWWRALAAPGVPMAAAWWGKPPISVTIDVVGTTVRSVTLKSSAVTVRLEVRAAELLIAQVTKS